MPTPSDAPIPSGVPPRRATAFANVDRREGGTWSPSQSLKNLGIFVVLRVVFAATRPAPPALLRALGRALGRAAFLLLPSARKTALANLAQAFPNAGHASRRALARRAYVTLGTHLGDTVALLHRSSGAGLMFPKDARDVLERAREEGRGVLFASAHLGPWEHVAATLVEAGVPLTVVARESYDPRLTELYERLRVRRGVAMIFRGARGSAAGILRALRERRVLGIPMDLRSRVPSIAAPFLGAPAPTPVGPARIALRTGAAVVVGSVAPAGGSLVVTMTRIVTSDLLPTAEGERSLTERINAELSSRICAYPEGWVWMHPRFEAAAKA